MSITVTSNADGTLTIQCGTDIVIVSAPVPKQSAAPDIPVLWPPGGVAASIIARGNARTIIINVPSADGLTDAIKTQFDEFAKAPKDTLFQFDVKGTEPLKVDELNKAISELGDPDWMGMQIRLIGDQNE
ncbi:hypothetical protein [Rhizobium etli]|uniref:hypothetical protein n=1 Tax=Rhizobium etli TaxID=29449 RepID=UPI0003839A58|nr:hypothetical protein [Rhizobium etli]AGS25801.1 hypothetical protein REMIM1_PF00131 [Rhizobium etli bv. mimosae str. Mim1]